MKGDEDCQLRLFNQKETELLNRIKYLNDQREIEKNVSNKIQTFLGEKNQEYSKEGDIWEKKRNDETTQLDKKIQDVLTKKADDEALKEQTVVELEREREYLEIK